MHTSYEHKQLMGVISDVLDVAKIEANQLVLEEKEFSLDRILQSVFRLSKIKVCVWVLYERFIRECWVCARVDACK